MTTPFEIACLGIDEVLGAAYEPLPEGERDPALAEARLERWRAISADGSDEAFGKRLARQGLDRAALLARLGGVRRRAGVAEPAWVADAGRIADLLKAADGGATHADIAFGPLLAPVIADAEAALRRRVPAALAAVLGEGAMAGMVDHLRRRLSNFLELPLYEAMLAWREGLVAKVRAGDAAATAMLMDASLAPFAAHLAAGGHDALFTRKPVLLRLVAMLVAQWQQSYGRFVTRLGDDLDALWPLVPGVAPGTPITGIGWGLSDPHNGGDSVLTVVFAGGARLFYKPKDVRTDRFVAGFVEQLAALGAPERLVVPVALVREGYGWTASVENRPCASAGDVGRYYRRFGAWLAVLHVLSASDMHMENFIASGADPVPVDFEMILQGLRQRPRNTDADNAADWLASRFLEASVQSVGMLPAYVEGRDGALISMGALEPSVYPVESIGWEAMNTPRMLLRTRVETVTIASNLPVLDGAPVPIAAHREAFLAGVREMLEFIGRHAEALVGWAEAEGMAHLTIRRVIRPTRFYYMLLKRLYDHRRMDDALDWSLEADFSARLFDWDENAEQPWKLLASERRQLLELGIPHFTMLAGDTIIADARGPVTRLHVDLGPVLFAERVRAMSGTAVASQLGLVRACLQMPGEVVRPVAPVPGDGMARALGEMLVERSFRAEASMSWLGLNRVDHEVAAQLGLVGHDLYYGAGGIGLFFLALSAKDEARASLVATARAMRSAGLGRLVRAIGIGGATGMGAVVYALARGGDELGDAGLIDASLLAAEAIDARAIATDTRFDVVAGSAGAALGLLALHRRAPADWLLDRAMACGDHLLARRGADGLWISSDFDRALTGAAHGAAGLAMAFSRLFAATGEPRFRQAARDCVAFENHAFSAETGNWRDLRSETRAPNQWCYGAVGIGLSRLAMLGEGAVADEELRADIERALPATLAGPQPINDTLCCGIAGHVELLALAGRVLGRPDLLVAARTRADAMAARWAEVGDFRWTGGSGAFNPGLFQGMAGIGFAALRAGGGTAPSPLLWQ